MFECLCDITSAYIRFLILKGTCLPLYACLNNSIIYTSFSKFILWNLVISFVSVIFLTNLIYVLVGITCLSFLWLLRLYVEYTTLLILNIFPSKAFVSVKKCFLKYNSSYSSPEKIFSSLYMRTSILLNNE